MKKFKLKPCFAALIVLVLTVLCIALGFARVALTGAAAATATSKQPEAVPAAYYDPYSFYFEEYGVVYDVKSNREIDVTETLTVTFTGSSSTGFIKDIPVNAGELVKNVNVKQIVGNNVRDVPFDVDTESSDDNDKFITVDIGDYLNKTNKTFTYEITYKYCLTKAQEGADILYLNVIGTGRASYCDIKKAEVTLKLPDGFKEGFCYVGRALSENTVDITPVTEDGRTVLRLENTPLDYDEGVTFKLFFDEGALTTYFDFTPYWFVIAGGVLLLFVIAAKFLFFNKRTLVPVVNFEAPENMSPLMMGKLIDGTVNAEDITSMIFFWADKGYLKINLDDQQDPAIIRIVKSLPEGTPDYEVIMFAELFNGQDAIKLSFLRNRFYLTVDRVTKMINNRVKDLYDRPSVILSFVFAAIAGILLGLAPMLLALTQISTTYLIFAPFISLLPLFFMNVLSLGIKANALKYKTGVKIGISLGVIGLGALFTLFYTLFVPSFVIGVIPKILLCVVCSATAAVSVITVQRSKSYTEKLNQIAGFKKFITLAEKEKLEKMLQDDPEYYYHILPYAQVLGVSDIWEDKFKDLVVRPPEWAVSSSANTVFNFIIFNRILRISTSSIKSNLVSRPSSSGSSGFGGFGGGGGGGHVGGGHGGGGFRGR